MDNDRVLVATTSHELRPDPSRIVLRPFLLEPGPETSNRLDRLAGRALDMPRAVAERIVDEMRERHQGRHADLEGTWLRHLDMGAASSEVVADVADPTKRLLVGALLTQGYAYEAAALTNPSIVPFGDPDDQRSQPFLMSLRAIGEGHISSIAFITGRAHDDGTIELDDRHPHSTNGTRRPAVLRKEQFRERLEELGSGAADAVLLDLLGETFDRDDVSEVAYQALEGDHDPASLEEAARRMHWLADSSYEVSFDDSLPISEHVLSPAAPIESNGMEDARFVRFVEDDGSVRYYATYTAYDGTHILPQLVETSDFHRFRISTLSGPASHHKGMAIFPRRVGGDLVALSRHDDERTFVLRSADIGVWRNAELAYEPEMDWDLVKTGNCGSPIETEHGWLVITHGVGPMRRYVIGALLLDLDQPEKVVARLHEPLIEPSSDEPFGYVPDVVYSCGSMLHGENVIIPFGYSDLGIRIAVAPVAELIGAMS